MATGSMRIDCRCLLIYIRKRGLNKSGCCCMILVCLCHFPASYFENNCWVWSCIILCPQTTTPPTYGICILQDGWTILVFFNFFLKSFSGLGLLGTTALPNKYSSGLLLLSWPRTSGICQPCSTFAPSSIIPQFPTLSLRDTLPVSSKYLISCGSK